MISTFADLLPHAMPHLRNCPEDYVTLALKNASRAFFSSTEVWEKELDAISLVADTAQYALDPAEDPTSPELEPEIRRIVKVKISGATQASTTYKLTLNTLTSPTTTYSITFEDNYVPTSSTTDGLVVTVTLVPDFVSGYLPTFVKNRWGNAIVDGALATLLAEEGRPWFSPTRASVKDFEYRKWKDQAIKERYTGRVGGTLTAGSPYSFDV